MKFAALALTAVLSFAATMASALESKPYTAAALAEAQNAGKPVALHFHADWCPTCRAQTKVFSALTGETDLDMTILVADYDKETELKRALKVRTQSTLIVYKGKTETTRLAGDTKTDALRKALKSAL